MGNCGFKLLQISKATFKARQFICDNKVLLVNYFNEFGSITDQLLIETNLLAEPDQSSQQTGNAKSRSTACDQ